MKNTWSILASTGWMDAMMDSRYWDSIIGNNRNNGIPQSIRYKGKKKRKGKK